MTITPQMEQWLRVAGYEYHCFISYVRTKKGSQIPECAMRLRDDIEAMLGLSIPAPRVFLDESEILGGDEWQRSLAHAICRSIAMVAICAPIYYHPNHIWCGREWAAMEFLGQKRLTNENFKSIIPVMFRLSDNLPTVVSRIEYVDISRVTLRGRRYYSEIDYRQKIAKIVGRIEQIAETIARRGALTDCDEFQFPNESAFADYDIQDQAFPFRS